MYKTLAVQQDQQRLDMRSRACWLNEPNDLNLKASDPSSAGLNILDSLG